MQFGLKPHFLAAILAFYPSISHSDSNSKAVKSIDDYIFNECMETLKSVSSFYKFGLDKFDLEIDKCTLYVLDRYYEREINSNPPGMLQDISYCFNCG